MQISRGTTVERDALSLGVSDKVIFFNVTTGLYDFWDGNNWILKVDKLSIQNSLIVNNEYLTGTVFLVRGYGMDYLLRAMVEATGTRLLVDAEYADASIRMHCSATTYQEISWSEDPANDTIGIWGQPYLGRIGVWSYGKGADLITFNGTYDGTGQAEVVVNEDNVDVDFIIEKNTAGEAFRYDAGNDLISVGSDTEIVIGSYNYHRQTLGVDTDGDWRTYADINGFYTQQRVSGNWVTKQTITT